MMTSSDYKERFKAEYYQLATRYKSLYKMLMHWDNTELDFLPTCPRSTYNMQLKIMEEYLAILELRAIAENIELRC